MHGATLLRVYFWLHTKRRNVITDAQKKKKKKRGGLKFCHRAVLSFTFVFGESFYTLTTVKYKYLRV